MSSAGVEIVGDLTQHSLIGLAEAILRYPTFRRLFDRLVRLAFDRRPDAIICVDFSGFNLRFAREVRRRAARRAPGWQPALVQYVSPQVWASRPRRARDMARNLDLLLSIFPFEQNWYAQHAPGLHVEFVGHPLLDRYDARGHRGSPEMTSRSSRSHPRILLLPGSRAGEIRRHLPVMTTAAQRIRAARPGATFRVVAASQAHASLMQEPLAGSRDIELQVGGLADALADADLAIASTGTVTLECAYFGVPAVAMYRTSWLTYQIGKRIVSVPYLAMPNLLAGEEVLPELIQDEATPIAIATAALGLLDDDARRAHVRRRLSDVIASLGGPGANRRAADAILHLLQRTGLR